MTSAHEPVSAEQWQRFAAANGLGDVVEARVVSVVPFGAFVELDEGVHGLLHISEWAGEPAEGDTLRLRINAIDGEHRRVSLTRAA
ncbi:small subunit ribosomal protein S1 [Labedaea rhizosphaerae]|uniref:Small subunit ribosomal protein S1 n=1 Tax=Labedaea rhizosphaerae TaxID=598644 RepID=A0A4V3CZD5_LABRH|nr:small subunit ribosomal protein S1 [Labedaea rhizosphaerae]